MQAVLECKQCGGQLIPDENQKIVYCKFCGSANAISVANRFGLYNRANYLRRQNEFDRALGVYEDIIKEDPTDAEAYFGMALCKYGIEYVDEPETGKKIPTCHRTRFTLMSQDEDFKKAIEYADSDTLSVYMDEATKIDTILKKIQKLSSQQGKYDVFICYKEGDGYGGRTQSSVLAQDIYEHLINKGYKTFFARKTLESKIGSDYEPIIFSALYSAKVMLVIGSKPEEFQAVWVRNEWVRFMERISNGEECTLIPLYKEMSPYELPNELANIQALDMGRIGFIQDLLDGVGKLVKKGGDEGNTISGTASITDKFVNVSGLKKRAFLFLEQGDFKSASQYFERVLDQNPEDSESYWGKLLAKLECHNEEELENVNVPIKEMQNFQMAVRFGTEEQKEKYQRYSDLIDSKLYEEAKRREEEERQRIEQEKAEKAERNRIESIKRKKRNKILLMFLSVISCISIIVTVSWGLYSDYSRKQNIKREEHAKEVKENIKNNAVDYLYKITCGPYLFVADGETYLICDHSITEYPNGGMVFILESDGDISIKDGGQWSKRYKAPYTAGGKIKYKDNGYPFDIDRHSVIPYPDRTVSFLIGSDGGGDYIKWGQDGEKLALRQFSDADVLSMNIAKAESNEEESEVTNESAEEIYEGQEVEQDDQKEAYLEKDLRESFSTYWNGKLASWRYQGNDSFFAYIAYDAQNTGTTSSGDDLEMYMIKEGYFEGNHFYGKGFHYANGNNNKELYIDFEIEIEEKDGKYYVTSDSDEINGADFEIIH